MTIYLDVIWLLNLGTDYLLLMLTGLLLKRKIHVKRILAGSFLASLYVLLIFFPYTAILYHPVFKVFYSMLIVVVSFGFKRFSYFFQNVAMFYLVTFMVGGGLLAIHYFMLTDSELLNGIAEMKTGGFGDPVNWAFVVIGFPIVWFFSRSRIQQLEVRKLIYDEMAQVEIRINDDVFTLTGLVDSGNQLNDPVTKSPVMIIDMNGIKLPNDLVERIKNPAMFSNGNHSVWDSRVRIIPYRAVGQENQFLFALRPDAIRIFQNGKVYKVKRGLIGLSEHPLSSEGDYQCIIHPKMLLFAESSNAS